MSYKTILVHAEPGPGSDARVRLAVDVAAMFDATLIGLGAEAFFPSFGAGYAAVSGMAMEAMRERIIADLPLAEQRFRDLASGVAAGVRWINGMDAPAKSLAQHARAADLIVSDRPHAHASAAFSPAPADLVMDAGAPVLYAAEPALTLAAERVVVGWKDSRESRRALADALPWLQRAKQVLVVEIADDPRPAAPAEPLKDVIARLERHGVQARAEVIGHARPTVADDIEHAAHQFGADLIVTGAYGHARLREWMLGGVTEDLLAMCSKCVLFSH